MKKLQLSQDNILYDEAHWISDPIDYKKMNYHQVQGQNQKILNTLKIIQTKLSKELDHKNKVVMSSRIKNNQNVKAWEQKVKNNEKLIQSLQRDMESAEHRREQIGKGLESKTLQIKFALERNINKLKGQIRQLKLQEHETQRKLVKHGDPSEPQNMKQNQILQQQLRVYSIKYVRLLDKYNKSTQKLALASQAQMPEIDIPEDIYDKELEEREEAQFKEYKGIVKLCQVLSHRNDSEHNKSHREYTTKLKQLQRIIMKLGQLDHGITAREGDIIESRKNIQLLKVKLQNGQSLQTRAMILSQSSLPRGKSYSTARLLPAKNQNKLRARGYSMAKLKLNQ